MNLIRVLSTEVNELGQRIVKFLRFERDAKTAPQAAPFGIDSHPVQMAAVYANIGTNRKPVIIGYINTNSIAAIGETRFFSTDENGEEVFSIHLKNDGTLEIGGASKHLARFEELKSGFDELKTDFNNLVTVFNAHVHSGVTTGPGSSAISPTPGTSSTASIDSSKIDEIKTL